MTPKNNNYVSLHNHSDHSVLDSTILIKDLVNRAVELDMKAIALTDNGTGSGLYEFITECNKKGIKPIPGVEFYVAPYSAKDKNRHKFGDNIVDVEKGYYTRLTVLAYNNIGLKHLFELIGESYHIDNFCDKPRIDLEMLFKKHEGLIVMANSVNSELAIRAVNNQVEKAKEYVSRMKAVFKDNFYIEIIVYQDDKEKETAKKLIKLGKSMDIEIVSTNDVHILYPNEQNIYEYVLAIGSKTTLKDRGRSNGGFRPDVNHNQMYLKSYEEMILKHPREFVDKTNEIADKVNVSLEYNSHLKPVIDVPEGYTAESYLRKLIEEGFERKRSNLSKKIQEESRRRIEYEFEVLLSNDFISYFLVVQDFINWGKSQNIGFGVGRGSVGGSEIAFLTGISNTDPIRYDLLFERFLSPGRGSICEIEYEDGTKETIMISEKKKMLDGTYKYIHQLESGDEIEVDE